MNFITILLVKLTSDGSKWPKLSFGEVLYRLKPRYYSFGDYYASVFCKFQEMRVYFLAEIRLYPFTHTVRIFVRQVLSHTYITQEGNGISAIVKPYRTPMKVAEKIVPLEKHMIQLPKI